MANAAMEQIPLPYPVRLSMHYPERLSRLSTFFRLILAIPVLIFIALLSGGGYAQSWAGNGAVRNYSFGAGGTLVVAMWATILVRGTIPEWLFDFRIAVHRYSYRAYAYAALLTDRYPVFEGDWDLQYDVDYPGRLSRWRLLFWKFITALPHFVVLFFLSIAAAFVVFLSWWAILFTGQFPRGLHVFVVGVLRWSARVTAYVESLTDAFPPFSMEDHAGPASSGTAALCAVLGSLLAAGLVAGGIGIGVLLFTLSHETKEVRTSYSSALAGQLGSADALMEFDNVAFQLKSGKDPTTNDVLRARAGYHLVEFSLSYANGRRFRTTTSDIDATTIRAKTVRRGAIAPIILTADGVAAPTDVQRGRELTLRAIFEIADGDTIQELRGYPVPGSSRHVVWRFQ